MNAIDHTLTWIRGELFEGKLAFAFGLMVLISGFLFWKIGTTPNAKAMLFPLLIVGVMFMGIGGGMLYSNPKRLVEFPKACEDNPSEFVQSEKARVETFTKWYPITRYVMTGLAIVGLLSFLLWNKPLGRAIGIALLLMVVASFVVDHFSEERADIYCEHLTRQDFDERHS